MMKLLKQLILSPSQLEGIQYLWIQFYQKKIPRYLFLLLWVNLAVAPAVRAATGNDFSRPQAYALGILGLVTIALSIYLFVVMFQPERF
jgi:K+-transporting ATPase KdpF subunit